jgi:hypothetical protein
LIERRKHHAWPGLGVGIDVDRGLFARDDLFSAIARSQAIRHLAGAVGRRGYDLGRTGVRLDDWRFAAAGRSDIGAIGERGPRPDHRQCENHDYGGEAAAALLDRLFALVITILIRVGVILIGLVLRVVVAAGHQFTVQRIVVACGIERRIGLGIDRLRIIFFVLRLGLGMLGRIAP